MDPITLTASAISSIIISKLSERAGEYIGASSLESTKRLVDILKQKYPEVLEKESDGQSNYRAVLSKIESAVEEDSEVANAVVEVGEAVKSEPDKEVLFKILSDVISNLQDNPSQVYNVQYNVRDKDDIDSTPFVVGNDYLYPFDKKTQNNISLEVRYRLFRYSLYFSLFYLLSSLLFVGLLVFIPLSLGVQQFLVALIALSFLFSFSTFRNSSRRLTQL